MESLKIDKRDLNIPNALSLFRLILVIPLIYLFNNINDNQSRIYLLFLLGIIVLTDNLDGFLARKLNQITEFGKIIDPMSDKVIIAIMAIFMYINGDIPAFYFWLVLFKNIYIFFGGIFIYLKIKIVPSSNIFGKISVFFLGIFLAWCLIDAGKTYIYFFLLYLSTVLIISTIVAYSYIGTTLLKKGPGKN